MVFSTTFLIRFKLSNIPTLKHEYSIIYFERSKENELHLVLSNVAGDGGRGKVRANILLAPGIL